MKYEDTYFLLLSSLELSEMSEVDVGNTNTDVRGGQKNFPRQGFTAYQLFDPKGVPGAQFLSVYTGVIVLPR